MDQPDPTPPPRGLKRSRCPELSNWSTIGARPRPTSVGIETVQASRTVEPELDNEPDPAPPPWGLKL